MFLKLCNFFLRKLNIYQINNVYSILTYYISRVVLEKLIGSQLVKTFPAFYVTQRFIIAFTNTRHLSLS